ncbi:hypothetical protein NC652_015367 [Populus alba x Populus x berolinensis]|nr:hypothetical protein NC652_015367 [Populus alba x Populus x berolinensis]
MKQGYNGLKYFSTIVAVCSRTACSLDGGLSWKVMAGIFSVTAAIYGTYWDLVMDWGLLQFKSKNWLLRDKLLIPYRSVYLGAMGSPECIAEICLVANCPELPGIFPTYSNLKCNCCQPSGLWNLFRLENEHLHNVVKYRAFKPVPLPFDYNVG